LVIGRKTLAQLRNAALIGVIGFAGIERLRGGVADETRGRQIALAHPEPDHVGHGEAHLPDLDDAGIRQGLDLRAQLELERVEPGRRVHCAGPFWSCGADAGERRRSSRMRLPDNTRTTPATASGVQWWSSMTVEIDSATSGNSTDEKAARPAPIRCTKVR